MWITEGGADLIAMRTAERLLEGFSAAPMIERAKTACAAALKEGGVESPKWRTATRPYYDCGSLFALAVEKAGSSRGEDFLDFVRELIAKASDGVVGKDDWFGAASRFGVTDAKIDLMRRMLSQPSTDPERDIAFLLSEESAEPA